MQFLTVCFSLQVKNKLHDIFANGVFIPELGVVTIRYFTTSWQENVNLFGDSPCLNTFHFKVPFWRIGPVVPGDCTVWSVYEILYKCARHWLNQANNWPTVKFVILYIYQKVFDKKRKISSPEIFPKGTGSKSD